MKLILTLTALFAIAAQAEVLKPKNTVDRLTAQITVADIPTKFSIQDRGWYSAGNAEQVSATKSYMFEYVVSSFGDAELKTSTAIGIDAQQKCNELGEIDYSEQMKAMPAGYKPSHSATINSNSLITPISTSIYARFVCIVNIKGTAK